MGMQLIASAMVAPLEGTVVSVHWSHHGIDGCVDGRSSARWKVKTCTPSILFFVWGRWYYTLFCHWGQQFYIFLVKLRGNWRCLVVKVGLWSKWEHPCLRGHMAGTFLLEWLDFDCRIYSYFGVSCLSPLLSGTNILWSEMVPLQWRLPDVTSPLVHCGFPMTTGRPGHFGALQELCSSTAGLCDVRITGWSGTGGYQGGIRRLTCNWRIKRKKN